MYSKLLHFSDINLLPESNIILFKSLEYCKFKYSTEIMKHIVIPLKFENIPQKTSKLHRSKSISVL